MAPKAWFKIVNVETNRNNVSLQRINDEADMKEAIKRTWPTLDKFPIAGPTLKVKQRDKGATRAAALRRKNAIQFMAL